MASARIVALLKSLTRLGQVTGLRTWNGSERLYASEHMARVLERERARTDRSGEGFSLLVLTSDNCRERRDALQYTGRMLKKRLRLTDEAGWLDRDRLGVVLPATPPSGALKLSEEICLNARRDGYVLVCKTYYYPSDLLPDEAPREGAREVPAVAGTPARPMEPLFVQGLPAWKRCLDLTGAISGIIFLLPVFTVAALAIKVSSQGPVFFKQRRSGLGGKPFVMYKFRSMVADAEARKEDLLHLNEQDGPAFKIQRDPRVTSVGRFLRGTSIDELPQLWNVVRGEMSLVGPRPLPCSETAGCDAWERRRLDVTPGITCIWQLKGRSRVPFKEWMRMDMQYIRSRSLGCDVKLLLCTVAAVLFGGKSADLPHRSSLGSPAAGS